MTSDEHGPANTAEASALAPYGGPDEHLSDLLLRHDWLLKRQMARGQVRKPADILGFAAISEHEVQRLLDEPATSDESSPHVRLIDRTLEQLQLEIDGRVELSALYGVRLPIIELAERFALTSREVDLLFACLAVELDRRYERVYGFLHDDMSRRLASPGLAIGLHCESIDEQLSARALLNAQAPLRYYHLLEVMEDSAGMPWLSRSMRIDERIVSFLVGDRTLDTRIARHVTFAESGVASLDVGATGLGHDESLERIVHFARASRGRSRKKPLIYLHGGRHSGADALVRAAAGKLGVPVMTVDVELLVDSATDFDQALFLLFREGLLSQSAIYLRNVDRALEQPVGASRYRALLRSVTDMGSIVFASGEHAVVLAVAGGAGGAANRRAETRRRRRAVARVANA